MTVSALPGFKTETALRLKVGQGTRQTHASIHILRHVQGKNIPILDKLQGSVHVVTIRTY